MGKCYQNPGTLQSYGAMLNEYGIPHDAASPEDIVTKTAKAVIADYKRARENIRKEWNDHRGGGMGNVPDESPMGD